MRCEECRPLIEEFADGELDVQTARSVDAHLSLCAGCAEALEQLGREQEFYAHYRRDVDVTPALWQGVRARIEREADPPRGPSHNLARLRRWLSSAALSLGLQPLNPALASALILITVGASVGTLVYLRPANKGESSASLSRTEPLPTPLREEDAVEPSPGSETAAISVPKGRTTGGGDQTFVPASFGKRRARARVSEPTPDEGEGVRPHEYDSLPAFVELTAPAPPALAPEEAAHQTHAGDAEVAKHLERAQILLRSFRNINLAGDAAEDLSYERQLSRQLLSENIILRRDAESQGDHSAEELLSSLEPFLLDIANIREKPSREDVSSIKERMQRKEIIAALQVY